VRSLAFVPGSNVFYSSGFDGKIIRWDLNGNVKSFRTLKINNFINRSLAISPNGRWLACGTTTTGIQLFNLNTGDNAPEILEGHNGWVGALAFTPDGKGLYSGSTDKAIISYDLIQGTKSNFVTLANTDVRCLAVSPSGRFLFGGTKDGKLIRWNMDTKEETVIYSSSNNTIHAVAINSTGSRVAFVDNAGSLRIADARTNSIIRTISAHTGRITDVKFSPDDRQIATAGVDKTVKIWNAENLTNRPIIIEKHDDFVLSVAFSSDGNYLVSGGEVPDNKALPFLFYWPAHAVSMADQMCTKLSRNLSQREWETYVSYDIPFQKTCPNK
jgi:WD40 repeat protein